MQGCVLNANWVNRTGWSELIQRNGSAGVMWGAIDPQGYFVPRCPDGGNCSCGYSEGWDEIGLVMGWWVVD